MSLRNLLFALVAGLTMLTASADNLIILHNNDTHSQIDPADNGQGGVVRRKVLIDSVRAQNPNVLLIDAGDAVQGTMYFTIYKGEVEYRMLEELGYDVAVVGNHDFDNGVESLAQNLKNSRVAWLTANYDLSAAPGLDSVFTPGIIKKYGNKKIGIFGINLVPEGMIAEGNYDGVVYTDAYDAANSMARKLRADGADYIIAVTHIGYDSNADPNDCKLAARTEGIDLIVGGHSHSLVTPEASMDERFHWKHLNAAGDTVHIVQASSRGAYLGQVTLNLDNGDMDYKLITVDKRLDDRLDSTLVRIIDGYRNAVDSIMAIPVGVTERRLGKDDSGLVNFLGDFVAWRGEQLAGRDIDISLINAGGVRRELPEGEITKGMIIDMLPFNNRVVVLEIKGTDLLEAVNGVIRRGGFDGTNNKVAITFNPNTKEYIAATIDGNAIDPDKVYVMATIDYLANGGDYMTSLPRAKEIARSKNVLYDDLLDYITTEWTGIAIDASPVRRINPVTEN